MKEKKNKKTKLNKLLIIIGIIAIILIFSVTLYLLQLRKNIEETKIKKEVTNENSKEN